MLSNTTTFSANVNPRYSNPSRNVRPVPLIEGWLDARLCAAGWLLFASPCFLNAAPEIRIQSPQEYQVFQRSDKNTGVIRLQGRSEVLNGQWQYRVVGTGGGDRNVDASWKDFPVSPQKGAFDFQATVPSGGWYKLEVQAVRKGEPSAVASVEHVGIGEVFVVAGQSNAGNHGSDKQKTETGMVSSFNGKVWAVADDPQSGASGNGGSFMPAFGDALAKRFQVPVGLVPIAAGGTSVREWLPEGFQFQQQTTTGKGVRPSPDGRWESDGKLFNVFLGRLESLGNRGARAVLWHQGESDAGQARSGYPADRQISGDQYLGFLEALVCVTRARTGWVLPWFSAQTTYHSEADPSDVEFREAQKKTWLSGITLEGPDTDTLRAEFRAGVHFNAAGLRRHGEMWSEKVARWLEQELEVKAVSGGPPSDDYKLVWSDEFDGPGLDTQKWKHRYIGPRKDGINDPSSISTDGQGNLLITCSRKDDKILAGMISTDGLFSATYGYFEARVRFQTQEGWWPGFWLMSNTVGDPDRGLGALDDTGRNGTEVDIFEYLRIRGDQIQHAMHWNGYGKSHKHRGQHARVPNLTSGYHTVGCEWLPDRYRFFVDGRMTWETTEAVSQRPEYIILSGEVSSWPGDISRATLPDSVSFDYIRVWQKP